MQRFRPIQARSDPEKTPSRRERTRSQRPFEPPPEIAHSRFNSPRIGTLSGAAATPAPDPTRAQNGRGGPPGRGRTSHPCNFCKRCKFLHDPIRCAATGQLTPLDQLRYWGVARQEAYASAELSVQGGRAGEPCVPAKARPRWRSLSLPYRPILRPCSSGRWVNKNGTDQVQSEYIYSGSVISAHPRAARLT